MILEALMGGGGGLYVKCGHEEQQVSLILHYHMTLSYELIM